jgi:hypothetical protein
VSLSATKAWGSSARTRLLLDVVCEDRV